MNEPRRITPEDVEAEILYEHYFTALDGVAGASIGKSYAYPTHLGLMTFCVLTLSNNFMVVGKSACADPAIFDALIGQQVARGDAIRQVWSLLGFRLRDELSSLQT